MLEDRPFGAVEGGGGGDRLHAGIECGGAHRPAAALATPDAVADDAALLDLLLDWAPGAATRKRILADNPVELYGFPPAVD